MTAGGRPLAELPAAEWLAEAGRLMHKDPH